MIWFSIPTLFPWLFPFSSRKWMALWTRWTKAFPRCNALVEAGTRPRERPGMGITSDDDWNILEHLGTSEISRHIVEIPSKYHGNIHGNMDIIIGISHGTIRYNEWTSCHHMGYNTLCSESWTSTRQVDYHMAMMSVILGNESRIIPENELFWGMIMDNPMLVGGFRWLMWTIYG